MPTPAESGFRHGWSTMPKLRVGMPPTILTDISILYSYNYFYAEVDLSHKFII